MKRVLCVLCVLVAMVVAVPVMAQTPINNPAAVVFDHVEWQTATRYEGGYFAYPVINGECSWTGTPAGAPTQTDDLGKPTTSTGVAMTAPLGARPKGCYIYKIRVLDASGMWSDWSEPSNFFLRRPVGPGKPVVK